MDVARTSRYYQIPFKFPDSPAGSAFPPPPFSTKLANQVICAAGSDAEEVARILWRELYGRGNATPFRSDTAEPLKELLGQDYSQYVDQVGDFKQTFISFTDEAVAKGAFGTPTMLITNAHGNTEFFFGSDRFLQIADFIGADASALINKPHSVWRSRL